jgi:hypothetical protein
LTSTRTSPSSASRGGCTSRSNMGERQYEEFRYGSVPAPAEETGERF